VLASGGKSFPRDRLLRQDGRYRSGRPPEAASLLLHFGAADATLDVVVDQAHRLHEGVDRGGADERPAPLLQVLRQPSGGLGRRVRAQRSVVHHRRSLLRVGLVRPEEGGKAAILVREFDGAARIVYGRADLAGMADDAGVGEQLFNVGFTEARDALEVEALEGLAEILALAQDGEPGQARLKPFQAQLLEQAPVVRDRPSPFAVMVTQIVRKVAVPGTARLAVRPSRKPDWEFFHGLAAPFTRALPDSGTAR